MMMPHVAMTERLRTLRRFIVLLLWLFLSCDCWLRAPTGRPHDVNACVAPTTRNVGRYGVGDVCRFCLRCPVVCTATSALPGRQQLIILFMAEWSTEACFGLRPTRPLSLVWTSRPTGETFLEQAATQTSERQPLRSLRQFLIGGVMLTSLTAYNAMLDCWRSELGMWRLR